MMPEWGISRLLIFDRLYLLTKPAHFRICIDGNLMSDTFAELA